MVVAGLAEQHARATERWLRALETYDSAIRAFRRALEITPVVSRAELTRLDEQLPVTDVPIRLTSVSTLAVVQTRECTLTPRQREIAALIASGLSNQNIADALSITPGTVANHVANILARLELRTRTQIAIWALDQRAA